MRGSVFFHILQIGCKTVQSVFIGATMTFNDENPPITSKNLSIHL